MRVWYPKVFTSSEYEDLNNYKWKCMTDLYVFKGILQKNMNLSKLKTVSLALTNCEKVKLLDNENLDAAQICRLFISYLSFRYDNNLTKGFYTVSELVKCPHTRNSIPYIIKLMEYGFDDVSPLNWIRHSYLQFCDYVQRGVSP